MVTCRHRNVMFLSRYFLFWNVFQNLLLLELYKLAFDMFEKCFKVIKIFGYEGRQESIHASQIPLQDLINFSETQKGKPETVNNISFKTLPWQSKHKTITILSDNFQVKCISFFVGVCLSPANLINEFSLTLISFLNTYLVLSWVKQVIISILGSPSRSETSPHL